MDDIPKHEIYFIFCQKGPLSSIASLDKNSIVNSYTKKQEKQISGNIYTLYQLNLSKNFKGRPFTLTLVDDMVECYMSYIYCKKGQKFLYDLSFEPIYEKPTKNLKQVFLSFKTQLLIFYDFLKNNEDNTNNDINTLFMDSIEYLSVNKTVYSELQNLLTLFFEINKLKINDEEINKRNLFDNFFLKLNLVKIFEHYIFSKLDIKNEKSLDEINFKKIRKELIKLTGNKEEINEKIDLFIMFFIIYAKPELFFEIIFENNGEDFEKIKSHLLKYKKVFKYFNSEVLSLELFLEATSLESIILVIKSFIPNMLELLKLFSNSMFFLKFSTMLQFQRKYSIINILDLIQPQKTDETEEFLKYYEQIFENFRNESFIPIKFDGNFFISYCKLFQNENYKKIDDIYKILQFHNKNVKRNYRIQVEEEILQYYHNTGIYLIEQKVLYNKEMFVFLYNDEYLNQDDKEKEMKLKKILDIISIGFRFDKNESKFFNDILNNKTIDDFNIQYFFGNLYGELMRKVFKKFTTFEDLLILGDCKIYFDSPEEILKNLILTVERIWKAHPLNYPENVQNVIAQSLAYSSAKIPEINEKVYKSLEQNIPNDILLSVYSLILIKQYSLKVEFREHIIDFIKNNCGNNALSIWYLLSTIDPDNEEKRVEFLKNNLKEEYTVKVEDFIDYLNTKNEKILLFQYLRIAKCFHLLDGELISTSYYINSIKAKYNILNLKYNNAMLIYKSIYRLNNLLMYFTPIEENREKQELIIANLLIEFTNKIGVIKNFIKLLEKISNFWEEFYPYNKREDIIKIKNIISKIEDSGLDDIEYIKKENNCYNDELLGEAEKGEQLKNSFFFIEIYNHFKLKKFNENDSYANAIKLFYNLKELANDNNINSLDNELKDIIISAIHKNRGKINSELNFIKKYFYENIITNDKERIHFKYNFSIPKIKRELLELVDNSKKDFNKENENLLDKEEEFEDFFLIEDNKIDKEKNKKLTSQELIMEENRKLIEEIHILGNKYKKKSKIIKAEDNDSDDKKNLIDLFKNFFKTLFETNLGFAKLETKIEFKENIINYAKEIYLNNVEIDLSKNDNLILITEFFDVLQNFELNKNDSKRIMFFLMKKIKELNDVFNNNQPQLNYQKIVDSIFDLLYFVKENVKEEDFVLLLMKLLVKESKKLREKNFYLELLNLIFSKNIPDFSFEIVYDYLPPFIEQIFGNEFSKYLDFTKKLNKEDDFISSSNYSQCFEILANNINTNITIEEMILFYFESKIMNKFNSSFKDRDFIVTNDIKYSHLEYFIERLEKISMGTINNNNPLLKLFSIAYIKCYYNKSINYLSKNYLEYEQNNNNNLFEEIYTGRASKQFKNSMIIYVLKLVYRTIGNLDEFEIGDKYYKYYMDIFDKLVDEMKKDDYWDWENVRNSEDSGFDFFIYPNNCSEIFFASFENFLEIKKKCKTKESYKDNFVSEINKLSDIDLLYCILLNLIFSFYYRRFSDERNMTLMKWMEQMINNNEVKILKDNDLLKNILLILINEDTYAEKIERSIGVRKLSYFQLFCLLISFRYVINIIKMNNKEGLFYNFINDPIDVFDKNKNFFDTYLKDITKDKKDTNYLKNIIIKYFIFSHLCICLLIDKISLEKAYQIIGHIPKEEEGNYLLIKLFEMFDLIKNDLLNTLGIKNVIIFMNSIFDDTLEIFNTIKNNIEEKDIKEIERKINETIDDKISTDNYKHSIDHYIQPKKDLKEGDLTIESNKKPNDFYDILLEKYDFYNPENKHEELPFISYLTYTNFSTYDDFEKQYLYFDTNDSDKYPIIDCIIKENKILKITEFIPKLNETVNFIYNELNMNITEDEANQKITDKIPNFNYNEFNNSLKAFLEIFDEKDINFVLNEETKISDLIITNNEQNKIFRIYSWIIKEYNKFYESLNIYNQNERYIKEVIIQNSTENDYISFKSNENKTIKDRLKDILCLYSKRNRINENQEINVYDGGKIIYNFQLIEEMLEEEFVLCKRKFSKIQKVFIFSNKVFNKERNNIFYDLDRKFPQIEIIDNDLKFNISSYLDNNNYNIKKLYYDCLKLIIYLTSYLLEEKLFSPKTTTIEFITKLMEKENNKIDEKFKKLSEDFKLNIEQIFYLYEMIEEKAFESLKDNIKNNVELILRETIYEEEEKINNLLNKNSLLKKELIIKGIKKYIVRYCIGNINGNDSISDIIKLEDIFNKKDIWGKLIFNNNEFKAEKTELCSLNKGDNIVLSYFYGILFKKEFENDPHSDDYEDQDDN